MISEAAYPWLHDGAIAALTIGVGCAIVIAIDIASGRRQPMAVMNAVWPLTALYSGPLGLWFYFRFARATTGANRKPMKKAQDTSEDDPGEFRRAAIKATTHCGAGCTLGDFVAEGLMAMVPFTLFGRKLFAGWALAFVFAFAIGIAFQYFTIVPMKKLSFRDGIVAALQADFFSLVAWQVGMYGWMAIAVFGIFRRELEPAEPVFWFMMQIAMIAGFMTSYPVNRVLLARGIKETM